MQRISHGKKGPNSLDFENKIKNGPIKTGPLCL
jgi:hypothetical protein